VTAFPAGVYGWGAALCGRFAVKFKASSWGSRACAAAAGGGAPSGGGEWRAFCAFRTGGRVPSPTVWGYINLRRARAARAMAVALGAHRRFAAVLTEGGGLLVFG